MSRILWLFTIAAWSVAVVQFAAADAPLCDCGNNNQSFVFDDTVFHRMELDLVTLRGFQDTANSRLDALSARLDHQNEILKTFREKTAGCSSDKKELDKDVRDIFKVDENYKAAESKPLSQYPESCAEATANSRKSGIYTIQDDLVGEDPFLVSCDEDLYGGAWTVVQRRKDGSVNFQRKWDEFKQGFGNLEGEFWIGLDKLYALTTRRPQELLIVMDDFDGARKYAKYDAFAIDDESGAYALKVLGNFSGDAGDSLTPHATHKFSTMDRDNDVDKSHCAQVYTGAWWHYTCHISNLNGQYLRGAYKDMFAQGAVWKSFRGYNYALKFVQMMIRPQRNVST